MKTTRNFLTAALLLVTLTHAKAQLIVVNNNNIPNVANIVQANRINPANETNCFANFEFNNSGNSKINAYLLSLLMHYNYPTVVMNNNDEMAPEVLELYQDEQKFLGKYRQKVGHYFNNATITRVGANNYSGYDPEAMVISTNDYIIISFRGTDRIAMKPGVHMGMDAIFQLSNYHAGEWVSTDMDAVKMSPPYGLQGKVHRGFNNSLQTMMPMLVDTLNHYNARNKKVWVIGHSLGSAHATLCATYLKKAYNIPVFAVYVYASPHVGDGNFISEIDRLFPGTSFQRFDFMDDPATMVPTYAMGYARAGTRNYYKKEKGDNNYVFNGTEVDNDLGNISLSFCMHNTHWYARAAYFELTENNPSMIAKVPASPARPTLACNALDNRRADDGTLIQSLENDFRDLAADILNNIRIVAGTLAGNISGAVLAQGEGTYKITCLQGGKTLNIPGRCDNQNGCKAILYTDDGGNNARFEIRRSTLGFVLKVKSGGKALDVPDRSAANGARLQVWDENGVPVLQNNQLWLLHNLGGNRYVLQNVHSGKVMDADSPRTSENGCEIMQWDYRRNARNQVWVLEKTGN